jgi:hypothetical protein
VVARRSAPRRPKVTEAVRWPDRALGVVLGLVLGIVIIILFVFLGSEQTIDAPSVENGGVAEERPGRGDR